MSEVMVWQVTEQAGAMQLLRERPDSPAGLSLQLMSLDGCYIRMIGGEWKEVKTLALGKVEDPVEEQGTGGP